MPEELKGCCRLTRKETVLQAHVLRSLRSRTAQKTLKARLDAQAKEEEEGGVCGRLQHISKRLRWRQGPSLPRWPVPGANDPDDNREPKGELRRAPQLLMGQTSHGVCH